MENDNNVLLESINKLRNKAKETKPKDNLDSCIQSTADDSIVQKLPSVMEQVNFSVTGDESNKVNGRITQFESNIRLIGDETAKHTASVLRTIEAE